MNQTFARVLMKDSSGNLLVIQDRDDTWNFPGGKKENDETAFTCAKREVQEEIGIEVLEMHEVRISSFTFDEVDWNGHFYFATLVKGLPFSNEPEIVKDIKYVQTSTSVKFPKEMETFNLSLFNDPKVVSSNTIWL